MNQARRSFIRFASILSAMSFSGISLYASPSTIAITQEGQNYQNMDTTFDPDGWL